MRATFNGFVNPTPVGGIVMPDTRKSYAFQLRVAVSYYCNLHCQHCYVPELNRDGYKHLLEDQQLSLDQIDSFLNLLIHELGLEKISVTGGETLLNMVWPRSRHVMQHALRNRVIVQLNTSGSGQVEMSEVIEAAEDHLDQLIVQISLDGINESQVDVFRGQQGAMKRAMKSIKDAVDGGAYVRVRYTMTEENYKDTVRCYEMVSDMGVKSFVIKPMFAAGTACDNQNLFVSNDTVKDVQRQLLHSSVHHTAQLDMAQPVYVDSDEFPDGANAHIIRCACGGNAVYLSTSGDIYPCMYLVGAPNSKDLILGNIKDPGFDFRNIWLKPGTCSEFRTAQINGNCTAQNILSRSTPLYNLS
jgi:radical SAM protein with 4Fe4S-binding SPASM domain